MPQKTGVLMRLTEMKGEEFSVDEVVIQPGVKANWLRFPGTRAEHRVKARSDDHGGEIELSTPGAKGRFNAKAQRRRRRMTRGRATVVRNGDWHRVNNNGRRPLKLNVTLRPAWNPKRAHFRLGDREFRGDEVWFEVKTRVGDQTERAMYQLHDLSANQGDVSVRLDPGVESIESFHEEGRVTITGEQGSGIVVIDGNEQRISVGERVTVNPEQRYNLRNDGTQPFQVRQVHRPQWEPDNTFYVIDGQTIPGDAVWFEFVVPD